MPKVEQMKAVKFKHLKKNSFDQITLRARFRFFISVPRHGVCRNRAADTVCRSNQERLEKIHSSLKVNRSSELDYKSMSTSES